MNYLQSLVNLRLGEEDKDIVLRNVKGSIPFKGSNLWILACAIVVASVGLNVNSTAVVIGAMLISPLMGPIVGAGFALGIYDFNLLKKSLFNLIIATFVGLVVSTIYFWLSPFKEEQSELLSRTSPTFYDVLIAFFGGLVGVIAVTRVDKGNPIPGVAIATALMPPLCTAGYGIAIGKGEYFAGAMFLYTINCTFICIATYIMVKYLNYPASQQLNEKETKKVNRIITIITILMILPSIYFAYRFLQEQQFKKTLSQFITKEFEEKGNTIIFQKTSYQTSPKRVELAFLDRKFTSSDIDSINKKLVKYNLNNTQIIIRQDSAFLAAKKYSPDIENEKNTNDKIIISELRKQIDRYNLNGNNVYQEAKAIFPEIKSIGLANQEVFVTQDSTILLPTFFYQSDKPLSIENVKRLRQWITVKLGKDTVAIYRK